MVVDSFRDGWESWVCGFGVSTREEGKRMWVAREYYAVVHGVFALGELEGLFSGVLGLLLFSSGDFGRPDLGGDYNLIGSKGDSYIHHGSDNE